METVRDILESPRDTDFRKIEKALAAQDDRCAEAEVALSALILRRRTQGRNGLFDALTNADCVQRIDVLATHLKELGAGEAAAAIRQVQQKLPAQEALTPGAILELFDENPELYRLVQELDDSFGEIDAAIESFLLDCPEQVLDAETEGTKGWPLARLRGLFS
jgi:hypothetical protein